MEIIGIVLIVVIVGLLLWYFSWSKTTEATAESEKSQQITVTVKGAYSPNVIKAKLGKPLTITFDRQEDSACSKRVIIDKFNISEELPDFGKKEITITPKKKGEFAFTCEMGMYQGKIIVE